MLLEGSLLREFESWPHLDDVGALSRAQGSQDIVNAVRAAFFERVVPGHLACAAATLAPSSLKEAVHALKGAAATVGALRMQRICEALEAAMESGDVLRQAGLAELLRRECLHLSDLRSRLEPVQAG